MTANIILDVRNRTKKGYPIAIAINHNGTRYVSLRKYAEPGQFANGNVTKAHPNHRTLSVFLRARAVELEAEVDYCNRHRLPLARCVDLVRNGIPKGHSGQTKLSEFWQDIIGEYHDQGKSTSMHEQSKKHIEEILGDNIYLDEIDYNMLNRFVREKLADGCGRAGTSTYLSKLRAVYNEAARRGLVTPAGNPFKGLISNIRSKVPVTITRAEFEAIKYYMPKKGTTPAQWKLMKMRLDLFRFQVLIGGHDLIELALLVPGAIRNGRISFERGKMRGRGGEPVDNLLVPEAVEILDRYRTPGPRVFGFIPHPDTTAYKTYRSNLTRTLHKVSEDLEIPKLSTKSPRYIFRSWAGEAMADIVATAQIQGHSLSGTTFLYQGRLPNHVVDGQLLKILSL